MNLIKNTHFVRAGPLYCFFGDNQMYIKLLAI